MIACQSLRDAAAARWVTHSVTSGAGPGARAGHGSIVTGTPNPTCELEQRADLRLRTGRAPIYPGRMTTTWDADALLATTLLPMAGEDSEAAYAPGKRSARPSSSKSATEITRQLPGAIWPAYPEVTARAESASRKCKTAPRMTPQARSGR